MELNFKKNGGYVIAIAQDWNTGQVLMVAHANPKAVQTAFKTKLATFWSMSRNELWTKGLTSGDTLKIKEIRVDCDRDAILYLVEPQGEGGACHIDGWYSCFKNWLSYDFDNAITAMPIPDVKAPLVSLLVPAGAIESSQEVQTFSRVLQDEEKMIEDRKVCDPTASHTAKSLNESISRVAQKIGEEGLEVALALTDPDQGRKDIINEAADLLYRLQIGLVKTNIRWSEIEAEIVRRRK